MARATQTDPDRVFVRKGRRHYRRRYSASEVRAGMVIVVLLALILAWVVWRGAHPDPALFNSQADLLTGTAGAGAVDRGPLPEDLTAPGWVEGPVSQFDASNLYEKINGREGFYKSFGFELLTFVSLSDTEDPTRSVDIEVFDLGTPANALGAYAGERPAEITPEAHSGGMFHFDRNAFFMTRDRHYIRAIGSEESPAILVQLRRIRDAFPEAGESADEGLPAPYAIFQEMGVDAGQVAYVAENAFSFGFAREVYTVLLDDGETEIFLVDAGGAEEADALAALFNEGFEGYGKPLAGSGTMAWIKDRYIGTLAAAQSSGSWVLGVRGSPNLEQAENAIAGLRQAVSAQL